MLASSFAASSRANSQLVRPRSQLATNRFLISLGQVFAGAAFTSMAVSNRFGVDFLYTSKVLSRMSKRPYYYLSVVRVPRLWGGYENSYTISNRGWSRIRYLQSQPVSPVRCPRGNLLVEGKAAEYLMSGMGKRGDLADYECFKAVAGMVPPMPHFFDATSILLFTLDSQALPLEILNLYFISPQNEVFRTWNRALYLQRLGIIPENINLPSFLLNAYTRGSSESTILLALLIRGGIELNHELLAAKMASAASVAAEQKSSQHETLSTNCENCRKYEKLFQTEKLYLDSLENDNSTLRSNLENTLQNNDQLKTRNRKLKDHITMMSQCIDKVVEGLNNIKDPPMLLPLKSYINNTLAGIVLLNYHAVSSKCD